MQPLLPHGGASGQSAILLIIQRKSKSVQRKDEKKHIKFINKYGEGRTLFKREFHTMSFAHPSQLSNIF